MDGSPAQVPCPHCGWSPGPREAICAACSAVLGRRGEPIYAAGRARRVFSHIVDNAVQSIPVLLVGQVVQRELDPGLLTAISIGLWLIVIAALAGRAQSPGKIMLGTRIRMADGSLPSRQRVIMREFFWWLLLSLPFYLSVAFGSFETVPGQEGERETIETSGLWWLAFVSLALIVFDAMALFTSPKRQALHDRVFGTMIERVMPGSPPVHAPHMPDRDPRDPPPAPEPELRVEPPAEPEESTLPPPRPPRVELPAEVQAALDELDRNRPHLTQSQYARRRRAILTEHGLDADA